MRTAVLATALAAAGLAGLATPASLEAAPRPRPAPRSPEPKPKPPDGTPSEQLQNEADRHFTSGVALFKDARYGDALAEFMRAYDIAPHPLVLYNIAECHRELLHYAEAVTSYRQFLVDGKDKVPAARLAKAQTELDALLTLVARVTVTVTVTPAGPAGEAGDDAALSLDGTLLDHPTMPLILAPGEHRLVARAAGRRDAERTLKLGAGDSIAVELALRELPLAPPANPVIIERAAPLRSPFSDRRLAVDAGFGMNLRRLGKTGAPSIGLGAAIGSRLGVGVDLVLVAYAVVPSVRVRVAGEALSLHVVGAVPIAFSDDPMSGRFVTMAGGLTLRYRPAPNLAFRLESYVSFAGKNQDTAIPTFLGGELWF